MRRSRLISLMVSFTLLSSFLSSNASAADTWLEMQSAHFKAWSNGGEGATRSLLWQLEQIRSAMTTLWPWMKTDLAKPMLVIGVKDEATMRLLAPRYWEQRGAVHPTSVWVTGADQHYMAIRTDLRGDDTQTINPYTSAYFSYANLVLASSFDRDLPLWFTRGLAGVVSNTIVRDNFLLLGPPIPWHLETIRTRSRLSLKELIAVNRSSPEYTREDGLQRFDAEAWAFVHLLMFGEQGKYQSSINRFSKMLASGTDVNVAFSEAIGRADDLESHFSAYINSSIYSYRRANVDANVSKERMQSRALVPAEVAAGRAALHVAMGRPTEARASIDEARKLDPNSAAVFVAEGLLFERNGEREQARSAFSKAAELGSSNAYAYYRSAVLKWPAGPQPDQQVLKEMETALTRATELNSSYGDAYASLAEVKAALRQPAAEVFPILARAVELEPSSVRHRLTAARVFWRYDNLADARKAAQVALSLADTDAERADVQRLLSQLPNDSAGGAAPRQAAGAAVPAADSSRSAPDPNALLASCQRADMSACTTLAPIAAKACADGQKRACVVVAMLQARGSGVPKDEARAYAAFEQLCDGGLLESCAQWAIVLASHPEKPDLAKARQLLTKSCDGGLAQACDRLKSLPK